MLTTGTHSGTVPLRIELHRRQPRLDERWDEIVEVSCDLRGRRLLVTSFEDGLDPLKVRQNGPHRVRYSALRFDDENVRNHRETALDQALAELAERDAGGRAERELAHEAWLRRWGGREPSARLRELDPRASSLATHHRGLVDVVEAMPSARQREVALEVARRACAADPDPFAAALRAIEAASWSAPGEDTFFADLTALVR